MAGRNRAQRKVSGFGAVGVDEHLKRFGTARAPLLESGFRDRCRRLRIVAVHAGLARSILMRHAEHVRQPESGHDVLDFGPAEACRQVSHERDLPLRARGEVGMSALGRRRNEPAVHVMQKRLAQPRAGGDHRHVSAAKGFAFLQDMNF